MGTVESRDPSNTCFCKRRWLCLYSIWIRRIVLISAVIPSLLGLLISAQAGIPLPRKACSPDMDSVFVWRRRTTPRDGCRSVYLGLRLSKLDVSCDTIQIDFEIRQRQQEFSEYRAWLCLPDGLRLIDGDWLWDGAFEGEHIKSHRVVVLADTEGVYNLKAYCIAVHQTGTAVYRCLENLAYIFGGKVGILCSRELGIPSSYFDLISSSADRPASLDSLIAEIMHPSFDEYPQVLVSVRPTYPEAARRAEIEGVVVVLVEIDERGDVSPVGVAKADHELLVEAAVEAARKFKFIPAKKDGVPVRLEIAIPFIFCLED